MTALFFLLLFLNQIFTSVQEHLGVDPWGGNLRPKISTDYISSSESDSIKRFLGNQTNKDYFKLLHRDGNSLLIGARNVVYNVSLPDLIENEEQRITWNSLERDVDLCLVKGKSEDDCQNYIRVLAQLTNDTLLVCGTNAYRPLCRHYSASSHSHRVYDVIKEFSGVGICPFDPRHNSTFYYTEDHQLYAGTVADFSGTDSLILNNRVRTGQYDLKQLNNPDFVSSLEYGDYVYFFFREMAVEYMNCGKVVYSRIARVCKSDRGGPHKFKNMWTSFIKARLTCSIPGNRPFYFDEIQSTTLRFIQSVLKDKEPLVYGVFTTADHALSGSAICHFSLNDISKSFEGDFKDQSTNTHNWLPIPKSQMPEIRPGRCYNNSLTLPETTLNFIKHHSLLDTPVASMDGQPIFVKTSLGERLTVIAVDSETHGTSYDVVFVGTTNGRVLKISNHVICESLQVFPLHVPVRNVMVIGLSLLILSDHEVNSIPLHRCSLIHNCGDCIALQDPYCGWNVKDQLCTTRNNYNGDDSAFLQNIPFGLHVGCPYSSISDNETRSSTLVTLVSSEDYVSECNCNLASSDLSTTVSSLPHPSKADPLTSESPYHFQDEGSNKLSPDSNFPSSSYSTQPHVPIYTEKTLTLATLTATLCSLLVGFVFGYFLSKKCESSYKLEFLDRRTQSSSKNDVTRITGSELNTESDYQTTPQLNSSSNILGHSVGNKSLNLLVNVPHKSETIKTLGGGGGGERNGTLTKVKRIYL